MVRTCVVLVTASGPAQARKISLGILNAKLAACVSILPKISSQYLWKGKIETSSESLLIIKTRSSAMKKLIRKIKSIHSYDVPEVISVAITQGNPDYLRWILTSTRD